MKIFVVGGGSGLGCEVVKTALQQADEVGYSTSYAADLFSGENKITLRVSGCDLRDMRNLDRLIEKITAFSPNRLIICPVRTVFRPLKDATLGDVFEDVTFNVSNIIGIAAAYAKARPTGGITFLLSHICFLYNPGFTLYKTGKDAIDSFAKSIQFEYPKLNVLRVYPGAMRTNFAINTKYKGLVLFPPQDPARWAARILNKERGSLIGPIDYLFLLMSRVLPFWVQKQIYRLLFQLSRRA